MSTHSPHMVNRPLIARLGSEWQALNTRPAVLRRAAGWGLGVAFDSLDRIVAATGYWPSPLHRLAGTASDALALPAGGALPDGNALPDDNALPDGNEVLRRLLVAARTDDVAARVVLQRLLPGVISRARRWGERRSGGSADAFDELLSATWVVIREFPVERRPRHLAANLLRDSEYCAFGRASRRMLVHQLTDPRLLDLPVEAAAATDPATELEEIVAGAQLLSDHERRLLALVVQGFSVIDVANALHISVRSVRNHRDAAVHRLRESALASAA